MATMPRLVRAGIDIGGTFTDVALEVDTRRFTAKLLTTNDDPADACLVGLNRVVREAAIQPKDIDVLVHGTTLATNMIIERKGAVTSMITTEGFRDVVEIGTEGRPEQYDINIIKPKPLVPRRRRFTVSERINCNGKVLRPLCNSMLESLLPALDSTETETLAICFLHAYAYPAHEQQAREFFATRRPQWQISLSSDISPEFREYERFSTTCANAYVQPKISRYLGELEYKLVNAGFSCELLLMLSSGGLTDVKTARTLPVRLVESGPAGGVTFACETASHLAIDKAISFDMGGTTAKLSMIDNGRAQTSRRFEVARVYRFRKDSGLPLRIPVIDMVEIGAGGGSIAFVDELQRLSVGPDSAGSDPGPACYGLGGKSPTVTDANVALGRICPDCFGGGSMQLDIKATSQVLDDHLCNSLGLTRTATAYGVTEIVCENMSSAARVHAIESGKNTNDRTLIAFGGAAPLHACQMADKLNIDRIIIPTNAGVGSAIGFLQAPVAFKVVRTYLRQLDNFDANECNVVLQQMEMQALEHVTRVVESSANLETSRTAYMRYCGQGHEIAIELPNIEFSEVDGRTIQSLFETAYAKSYGRSIGNVAGGEIVSLAVNVSNKLTSDLPASRSEAALCVKPTFRKVFDSASQKIVEFAIFPRETLQTIGTAAGPAIILEHDTSTVVSSCFEARTLAQGEIELQRIAAVGAKNDKAQSNARA